MEGNRLCRANSGMKVVRGEIATCLGAKASRHNGDFLRGEFELARGCPSMNRLETVHYTVVAGTPIWTGSVRIDRARANATTGVCGDRLITTGLLGSIRWWFEVLVRGLGGSACDPSLPGNRCPGYSSKKATDRGHHCVVCELFGCTGWGRKFRFEVKALGKDNLPEHPIQSSIGQGQEFCLCFTPLRFIRKEEWTLLDLTLRLMSEYGAIGGRTVLKPSDEFKRQNELHHHDYGIVRISESSPYVRDRLLPRVALESYVTEGWRQVDQQEFAWASLTNFWFVRERYLTREKHDTSSYNKVLGRKESKACVECGDIHNPRERCPRTRKSSRRHSEGFLAENEINQWLAGGPGESKKVFSFKSPARTFGFVNNQLTYEEIRERLSKVWGEGFRRDEDFLTGEKVLDQLFGVSC